MLDKNRRLWTMTLVRGGIAIMTGCLVMITVDMEKTILLVSVGVAMAVTALALYGILDSLLILASSFAYPHVWPRRAMQVQGTIGIVIGTLLLSLLFDHAGVEWFLPMAVVQALSTAVGEVVLLNHTREQRWAVWDLAGAFVATCFGVVYTVMRIHAGTGFSPVELTRAIYLYLLLFGAAQAVTSVRMLMSRPASSASARTIPRFSSK